MNFQEFFHLRENPFGETPNIRFYFSTHTHGEALRKSIWAIEEDKAFILLSGEPGSGKTMLSRMLYERFRERANIAMIVNPLVSPESLLQSICREFGLDTNGQNSVRSLEILMDSLVNTALDGKRNLLLIDEAQGLSPECLEFIRLLTNLETHNRKLLQIILLGQPDLEKKLASPELRQLHQRIFLRINLAPLSVTEISGYVRHRLALVGGENFVRFDEKAIKAIYRISRGVPRLINKICECALREASDKNLRHLGAAQINHLPLAEIGVPKPRSVLSITFGVQFR